MKEIIISETWELYRSCWSDSSSANRKNRLREITSNNFEYRDPNIEIKGYQDLSDYMEQFQNEYSSATFVIMEFLAHHNRSLARWNMVDLHNEVLGNGSSYALYDEGGKLKQVTGFFNED